MRLFLILAILVNVLMGIGIDRLLLKSMIKFHELQQNVNLIRFLRIFIFLMFLGPFIYFYFQKNNEMFHLARLGGWLMAFLVQLFFLSLAYKVYGLIFSLSSGVIFWDHTKKLYMYLIFYTFGIYYLVFSFLLAWEKPEVVAVDIKIKNFPSKNFSIVQISDLHLGIFLKEGWVKECVDIVNSLNPDLVVITGDLVDSRPLLIMDDLRPLADIRASQGVYFTLGNHEYYNGVEDILVILKKLNIRTLLNDSVLINTNNGFFNLAGLNDRTGHRMQTFLPDLNQVYATLDKNLPTILMAHQPKDADEVASNIDLVLSGHTHAGQIMFFAPFVRLVNGYLRGLYRINSDTQLYVNRGTGFWGPPIRFPFKGEITHLRISPK